jgi:hypothetical protein
LDLFGVARGQTLVTNSCSKVRLCTALGLLLFFIPACTGRNSTESAAASAHGEIAFVDLYGLRAVSPESIRNAIGKSPEISEQLVENLRATPGVRDVSLELVCCVEGRSVLFVGIVEAGSPPPPSFRPRPEGEVKLPSEFEQAYAEYLEALSAAVAAGRSREDRSEGHALAEDPDVRAVQEKFIDLCRDKVGLLQEVLANSRYDEDRVIAAHVIAYAEDKLAVLPHLLRAASDRDPSVRNNAIRAIAVLVESAEKDSGILQLIDPEPFIAMLSSPEWKDRNKAIGVLLALTEERDPRWTGRFQGDAVSSLAEMARWQSPSHARAAFNLLGRLVGLKDDDIEKAWSASDRDGWIAEAESMVRAVN